MMTRNRKPAKGIHRLNRRDLETSKPGFYSDGGNLFLEVKGPQSKSWVFRYQSPTRGRRRNMGFGSLHTVTADEARERARQCRLQILAGGDPKEERDTATRRREQEEAKKKKFWDVAEEWLVKMKVEWSPRTYQKNRRRLEQYAKGPLGDIPIQEFSTDITENPTESAHDLIYRFFEPIWQKVPKPAEQLQGYIYGILQTARQAPYIHGDNAASKDGPAISRLPKMETFHKVKPHAWLPYEEVGAFMARLRACGDAPIAPVPPARFCALCDSPQAEAIKDAWFKGAFGNALAQRFGFSKWAIYSHTPHIGRPFTRPVEAYCLEFLILTGVRREMDAAARWADIDMEKKVWNCVWPKTEKKTGSKGPPVPLSSAAMAILHAMEERQTANNGKRGEYVFTALYGNGKRPMAAGDLNKLLDKLRRDMPGRETITVHGFRKTFGSWMTEHLGATEVDSELSLGHTIGTKVRNTYKPGAFRVEPRRTVFQTWADYCSRVGPLPAGSVIPFRQAK